jgi:hypothetical protein
MEKDTFDAFTRQLTGAGTSRRQALRALGGALLGGILGPAGFAEVSEACDRKRHKRKGKNKRPTPSSDPGVPVCTPTSCPPGSTFNAGACRCQCADNSFVCPAGNQCCGPARVCTVDGCCDQAMVCQDRDGVERCCR